MHTNTDTHFIRAPTHMYIDIDIYSHIYIHKRTLKHYFYIYNNSLVQKIMHTFMYMSHAHIHRHTSPLVSIHMSLYRNAHM